MRTSQDQDARRISAVESAGLLLIALGVVGAVLSGGTPIPLMLIGFAVFVIGWMLRRN